MVKNLLLRILYLLNFWYCCFGQKDFQHSFYLVFEFVLFFLKNKALGSVKNPSWLYQEPVMALGGFRHGSVRNPSWLCEKSVMALGEICHLWRLASKSQRQCLKKTDSSQSHEGFLTEPWWTPPRALTDSL